MVSDVEIRMEAIKAASVTCRPSDDVGDLLVHADWLANYMKTGKLPETDTQHSVVAGGIVSAA